MHSWERDDRRCVHRFENKCAAPTTTSIPIAKPAAECIQTNGDEDFLDCVGKPSFPLAMTAAECIQTFGRDFWEETFGKTSSPLATPTAECIQTKSPDRKNPLDQSHIYSGKPKNLDSDNPYSSIGHGRSGDLAPELGADSLDTGPGRCRDIRSYGGDSPAKSSGAANFAASRNKQKKQKRRTRHGELQTAGGRALSHGYRARVLPLSHKQGPHPTRAASTDACGAPVGHPYKTPCGGRRIFA